MAEVRVVPPGGGEPVDLGPIQIQIVEAGQTTDHRLGIALIRVPANTSGPPPHWHERHDEGFYVVFTPDLYVQYFRDLAQAAASGEPLTGERILDVMRSYSTFPAADQARD